MTTSDAFDATVPDGELLELATGNALISIREIDEFRASIPYLLGFYPEQSLVAIGLGIDNTVSVTMRIDAPRTPAEAEEIVEYLCTVLERARPYRLVVAYCDDYEIAEADINARSELIARALRAYETVVELAPVIERAFDRHGYDCAFVWPANPGMPREPQEYVPQLAVAQVMKGRVLRRSRTEYRDLLRPVGGEVRTATREAIEALRSIPMDATAKVASVCDLLEQHANARASGAGRPALDPRDAAVCALACDDITARDIVITLIAQDPSWTDADMWCRVAQLVPTAYVAATATIAGMCAYLEGNGAHANVALDEALRRDPHYSLALMMSAGLAHGLPPHELRSALAATFDGREPLSDVVRLTDEQ